MQNDKRQYERHSLDFILQVKGKNDKGQPFVEKTRLLNISGGGAQFVTTYYQNYYQGQTLEASIVLPETPEVKGHMNTKATVIRLSEDIQNDPIPEIATLKVSVCFQKYLQLIRNNHHVEKHDTSG